MKTYNKFRLLPILVCAISLLLATTSFASKNYQSQQGYNKEEGEAPDSIDGVYDGLEDYFNNTVVPDGCTGAQIMNGEVGSDKHGADYSDGSGQDHNSSSSESKEETGYVEIMGTEKGQDSYKEVQVIEPGSTITTEVKKPGNSSTDNGKDTSTEKGTSEGNSNENDGSSTSGDGSNSASNKDSTPTTTLPSLKDLTGLSDYDKYNMMFADTKLQMETNNTYTGPDNPYGNSNNGGGGGGNGNNGSGNNGSSGSSSSIMSGNISNINGKDYYIISDKEFENATQTDDGIFEITTTTGNTIRVELELVPGTDDEWRVKEFVVGHKEFEEEEDESDSKWTTYREEELFCYWEWKNLTNKDWIRLHGDHYYPISGSASTSRTSSSTLKWELGHGPYDDGTWSFKMTPRMKLYQERYRKYTYTWIDEEGKTQRDTDYERLTREKEKWASAVYYEVTVPLVCNTCPEITICLSDEDACDCGDLNTKCDDELEPEYIIDHRSELTN